MIRLGSFFLFLVHQFNLFQGVWYSPMCDLQSFLLNSPYSYFEVWPSEVTEVLKLLSGHNRFRIPSSLDRGLNRMIRFLFQDLSKLETKLPYEVVLEHPFHCQACSFLTTGFFLACSVFTALVAEAWCDGTGQLLGTPWLKKMEKHVSSNN